MPSFPRFYFADDVIAAATPVAVCRSRASRIDAIVFAAALELHTRFRRRYCCH